MTRDLVSFTDHQSASLEGDPAQNFFFFPFSSSFVGGCGLLHSAHTVWSSGCCSCLSVTGVRNKKPRLYLCNAFETQVELSFAGSQMVPESLASADPSGFMERCTSPELATGSGPWA